MSDKEQIIQRSVVITGIPGSVDVEDFIETLVAKYNVKKPTCVAPRSDSEGGGYTVLLHPMTRSVAIKQLLFVNEYQYQGKTYQISLQACAEEDVPEAWLGDPPNFTSFQCMVSEPRENLDISDLKDTFLECPVCVEHFNQTDRRPRLLHSCLHAFCTQCLHQLLIKEGKGQITCPLCRRVQKVTGNADSLPVDPVRSKLVDYVQIKHKQNVLCTECEAHNAVSRCQECQSYLCEECDFVHRRHRLSRDHIIISIDDVQKQPIKNFSKGHFCPSHPRYHLEFYCTTDKQLCCLSCTVVDHKGHDFQKLEEAAALRRQELETRLQQTHTLADHLKEIKEKGKVKEKLIVEAKLKSLSNINNVFDDLRTVLDHRKHQLVAAVLDRSNSLLSVAQKASAANDQTLAIIESTDTYFTQAKEKADVVEMLQMYPAILRSVDGLQKPQQLSTLDANVDDFSSLKEDGKGIEQQIINLGTRKEEEDDDDVRTLYFENRRRSAGGDVEKIEVDADNGTALVYFEEGNEEEEDDDVDDDDDSVYVLEVKGLKGNTSGDTLALYFENRRRSAGGDVEKIEVDADNGTALVYFEEGNVVERVVQKVHHLDGTNLQVSAYMPTRAIQKGEDSKAWLREFPKGTVLEVHRQVINDVLQLYFKNKKRSGGEVQKIRGFEEEDAVFLIYSSPEEAKRVLKKQHVIEGKRLDVQLYDPPKPRPKYQDRFLIRGLKETTTKKALLTFLQEKCGIYCKDNSLSYGEEPGTVLVAAGKQPLRIKGLKRICSKRPLEGAFLEISDVPLSNCILVKGLKTNASLSDLELYFESKMSGNDMEALVERCEHTEKSGQAYVYFDNHKVIQKILSREHKLDYSPLSVSLYNECLGETGGDSDPCRFKLPQPVVLDSEQIQDPVYQRVSTELQDF